MKLPELEKWIPNLFMILLFENGRKHGLGLQLIYISVALFVFNVNGFGLFQLEAGIALGAGIFMGGNLADQAFDLKNKKVEKNAPPAA